MTSNQAQDNVGDGLSADNYDEGADFIGEPDIKIEPSIKIEPEESKGHEDNKADAEPEERKEPRIKVEGMARRPKLYPETELADYRAMKRRLLNPSGRIEVTKATVDTIDMLVLRKEAELLEGPEGTAYIEDEIIPKLSEAIRKGQDRFRGFHLWEAYDPEVRKRKGEQ